MNYWFVKSPFRIRSWQNVLVEGVFKLYGIRNHQAKNNIAQMKKGDLVLYYHSPSSKSIYGIMKVSTLPYNDKTTKSEVWLSIDFEPINTFEQSISLQQIKNDSKLHNIGLIKQPRVSVLPLSKEEFEIIRKKANIKK
ncbi:MAG TPA: EVE domain-containing protein [Nitrospirae bacterium]|nr:EVE domain protein [bacterium BMS3Bbin09]HDH04285.1 EVE domain-containing protein [Nitrospirota bacterium]